MAASHPVRVGRYVLHRELAAGGMASVHFGRLLGSGGFSKTVAIKRLHRQFARDPQFRESILEEGRLAARIRHPNVVPPLDVLSEEGELLLVMEYVHGESLSKLLRAAWTAGEPVPLGIVASIASNLLHGLHAAHEARDEAGKPLGIVHRDMSPQNVLVGVDGVTRVIDFGIAKAATSRESTSAGIIKGKLPYLAPEQLEGEPATQRADLFAASIVLWEMLAGRWLFAGGDDAQILREIAALRVEPPSRYNAEVPRELDRVVLRGLARDPAARFRTAREMALEVEHLLPLATPTTVGAWAGRLAAEALAKRARALGEVERGGSDYEVALPPPPVRTSRAPSLSSVTGEPSSEPRSTRPPGSSVDTPTSPGRPRLPPAGALAKPAIEIPNVAWLPPPPEGSDEFPGFPRAAATKPRSRLGRAMRVAVRGILGVTALALVVAILLAPMLSRELVVAAAKERGVLLTVDRVELGIHAVKLTEVHAKLAGIGGVEARSTSIEIGLARLWPRSITVTSPGVKLEGGAAELGARLALFFESARRRPAPFFLRDVSAVKTDSARLEWSGIWGEGSRALLENVTVEVDGGADAGALGDSLRIFAPLSRFQAGDARAGPWRIVLSSAGGVLTGSVALDPAGNYAGRIDWTRDEAGAVRVRVAVPSMPLAEARLPATFLGAAHTAGTRVSFGGDVELAPRGPGARRVAGKLTASVSAVSVLPGAKPLDLAFDVPIEGDAGGDAPVSVDGASVTLSSADAGGNRLLPVAYAQLAGEVTLGELAFALRIDGGSTAIACVPSGSTSVDVGVALRVGALFELALALAPASTKPCTPRVAAAPGGR